MRLFIFDEITALIVTAVTVTSFTIVDDRSTFQESSFSFDRDAIDPETEIASGMMAAVFPEDLAGTAFEDKGFGGVVSNVSVSGSTVTLKVSEIVSYIMADSLAITAEETRTKVQPASLIYNRFVLFLLTYRGTSGFPRWFDQSSSNKCDSGTFFPPFDADSVLDFADSYRKLFAIAGFSWEWEYSMKDRRLSCHLTFDEPEEGLVLNADDSSVSGLSLNDGGGTRCTAVQFLPSSANTVNKDTRFYYLQLDGSVMEADGKTDPTQNAVYPIVFTSEFYSDSDIVDGDAGILESRAKELLDQTSDQEISLTLLDNNHIPQKGLSPMEGTSIRIDGRRIETRLTRIQYSNSLHDPSLTFGFKRDSLSGRVRTILNRIGR